MTTKIISKKKAIKPAVASDLSDIVYRGPAELKPWPGNPRTHDEKQLAALMTSITEFGFTSPVLTNEDGVVLAGHGRLEAGMKLGLDKVPTRVMSGLSKAKQRAYVLADNKIGQMSEWDDVLLKQEVELLIKDDFNIEMTGFSTAEIDILIEDVSDPEPHDEGNLAPEDLVEEPTVTKPGDIWKFGDKHRLICGSSLLQETYALLMKGQVAQMVVTDPPYNVKIDGHVCGNGTVKHDEFAMASGEMTQGEFTDFLSTAFNLVSEYSGDGAIVYSFMDWRHQREILSAGEPIFGPLKQLCVWAKDNGGMGTFYRSQHELVYVFKNGQVAHINNFGLGEKGRYRTNVWQYPGVNTFKGKSFELLKLHPTVKPVGMIADAIRDCSYIKGIVLDPFAGSGTILMAAERTGRHARAIELDPKYVDIAIRRWMRVTGEEPILDGTDARFSEVKMMRAAKEW